MTERDEILAAWATVYDSGRFVLGPELEAFEFELANFLHADHVIGVSSGTDALRLSLEAIGVVGREVVVPALTFIATAEAVVHAGGTPVFCDVDAETWNMSAETVRPHISRRTKAIVPVDLFGNPAPFQDLRVFGLPLVEDACQAIGATYGGAKAGTLGDVGAISFYPSKILAGCGDGGAIVTNDYGKAAQIRLLRSHGSDDNVHHARVGSTSRLDELQAAALRVRLRHLPERLSAHQRRGTGDQKVSEGSVSACHQTVRLGSGPGRRIYPTPCHLQPAMRGFYRGALPNSEDFSRSNHAEPQIEKSAGSSQTENDQG